jgi:hypothetical protein
LDGVSLGSAARQKKGATRGSLHYAANDEAVRGSGRDDELIAGSKRNPDWGSSWGCCSIPPIAKDKDAMDRAPAPGKRRFPSGMTNEKKGPRRGQKQIPFGKDKEESDAAFLVE